MEWTSVLAIYALFWVMTAFVMLPFGVKTHDEVGAEKVKGQADSAPANFEPRKHVIRATAISAVLTAIYVANYVCGWITTADIDAVIESF